MPTVLSPQFDLMPIKKGSAKMRPESRESLEDDKRLLYYATTFCRQIKAVTFRNNKFKF